MGRSRLFCLGDWRASSSDIKEEEFERPPPRWGVMLLREACYESAFSFLLLKESVSQEAQKTELVNPLQIYIYWWCFVFLLGIECSVEQIEWKIEVFLSTEGNFSTFH